MSNVLPLSRWKDHKLTERECFSSDDDSDLEEESSDDMPIVIPTRKLKQSTKPKPKLIIPKKSTGVRPLAIKRAAPEVPAPPQGPPSKRNRFSNAKASEFPSRM